MVETEPKNIGAPDRRFLEGDIPTGVNMTQEEVNLLMRRKQVVDVVIKIEAACGSKELGGYERALTVSLRDEDLDKTERVLEETFGSVGLQVSKLVTHWKKMVQ